MIFTEKSIYLEAHEKRCLHAKKDEYHDIGLLHEDTREAFETELSSEFKMLEALLCARDNAAEVFDTPVMEKYPTYSLGAMLVRLESRLEVQ